MLDRFIASLPTPVLALGAIFLGFIFIVATDPPHTECDAQMELFREAQKAALYDSAVDKGASRPPMLKELQGLCLNDNSPGGCFEYFVKLKKLSADLSNIPTKCSSKVAKDDQVQTYLFKALALMAQMSWGDRGPASLSRKQGWFDASDVALFCDMKRNATRLFGQEAFFAWRESTLKTLPGAEKLSRDELWQKSLFSSSCDL